jgi:carbamoyl-phosphate synthase large subunit
MRRDLRDGNTYRAYVEPDFRFDAFLAQLGERLGGVGPINCQFRVDSDGPKIFEINARFSGTTPLRTYAGYNEVDYVVRHFVLGEPIPRPAPNPVIFLRYWDEITIDPQQLQTLAQAGSLDKPRFMRPTSL